MIDDTSDKVRRNLVAFSFLITLSQVFELEPNSVITILNGVTFQMNSPIKFWFVITSILIYLFFRYWFDKTRGEHLQKFHEERRTITDRAITTFLRRDLVNTLKYGKKSRVFSDLNPLEDLKRNWITPEMPLKIEPSLDFYDPSTGSVTYFDGLTGRTSARFELVWKNKPSQVVSAKDRLKFDIPRLRYLLICLKSSIKLGTLTKSNFDFIIPILLASIALLICLIKVGNLILTAYT
jgi:hypothetical protein